MPFLKRLSSLKPSRRKRLTWCVILLLCAAVWGGWRIWRNAPLKNIAGIYLTDGGRSFLVLAYDPIRGLRVTGGELYVVPAHGLEHEKDSFTVSGTKDRLIIENRRNYFRAGLSKGMKRDDRVFLRLELEPSQTIPGDWDLTTGSGSMMNPYGGRPPRGRRFGAPSSSWRNLTRWAGDLAKRIKSRIFRPGDRLPLEHPRTAPPIRSYLHRLDDPRVALLIAEQYGRDPNKTQALRLVRLLHADHPRDPVVRLHVLDLEARHGDKEKAAALAKEWGEELLATQSSLLRRSAWQVLSYVRRMELEASGKNADGLVRDLAASAKSLEEWLDMYKSLEAYESTRFNAIPLCPSFQDFQEHISSHASDMLRVHVLGKTAWVLATLLLFEGKREESFNILCGAYRMGVFHNFGGRHMERLMGAALRAMAVRGLEVVVLNTGQTTEDVEGYWPALEELHRMTGESPGAEFLLDDNWILRDVAGMHAIDVYYGREGVIARQGTSDAKFQNLRAGTAVRHRLLATGRLPAGPAELAPLLPAGLPDDPFSTTTLRYLPPGADGFTVYSVGPDRKDDGAAIEYDSTNGTKSVGDIFLRIPLEREFPFPEGPVQAADAPDLLRQFPNGLPADPFSDFRGMPLSILDSTATQPLVVFSWGPDRDSLQAMSHISWVPPVHSTPPSPLPKDASVGRRRQQVFRHGAPRGVTILLGPGGPGRGELRTTPGTWRLEAPYDSSNGTTSDGDVFLVIPTPQSVDSTSIEP